MRQEKLRWEKVTTTTQIPELIVCPDHTQIFMFSAATWNRHHIHYNKDAAVSEGLPDIVVQRALIGNFLARLITGWIGDSAELRKLTWKVTRSAMPGKNIVCRGKIKEIIDSEDGKYLICELAATDQNNELIASGDATVVFSVNHTTIECTAPDS
jgi:hydroxyacyl-ACP dehydratase HTD2-like protein with hotdog domain